MSAERPDRTLAQRVADDRLIDALLAENQKLKECYEAAADSCDATAEDLNIARAENQRLREALERITVYDWTNGAENNAVKIAREALRSAR